MFDSCRRHLESPANRPVPSTRASRPDSAVPLSRPCGRRLSRRGGPSFSERGRFVIAMLASLVGFVTPASSSTTDFRGPSEQAHARAASTPVKFIQALAFDRHDSKTISAVLEGDPSLYRSTDGAQTWRRIGV